MIGATYSPGHYTLYQEKKDKNLFEEIIDQLMIDNLPGIDDSFRQRISSLDKDKKRLAILSFLDKDRNLFLKIKALINKDINRMEHINDVVTMLREYVKVGDVEKKKYGEVMTPIELVEEMLATLPNDVWSNPNLKWLDPANGTGPYPIVVICKLMTGLKDWEPDDEKRYKHIVENMIHVCELQPKNMFVYMCVTDPFDTYRLNIYTGSFLEEGFNYHMKNVWGIEKFDIVMGNPPYNNGTKSVSEALWIKFIKKAVNISNYVLMITPKTWCNLNSNSFDKQLYNIFKSYTRYVNISDDISKTHFKGVGSTFSYYLLDISKNDYIFELESNDGKFELDYDNIKFIPQIFNNTTLSILNKTIWSNDKKIDGSFKEITGFRKGGKNITDIGTYKVSNTSAQYSKNIWLYSDTIQEISRQPKVIFSDSGYNKPYFDKGEINLGHHSRAFFVKDENESKYLINFLNSDLVKFLSKLMVPTGSCVGFERFATFLPYKYNEISLTNEEAEYIKNYIKIN